MDTVMRVFSSHVPTSSQFSRLLLKLKQWMEEITRCNLQNKVGQ